MRITPELDNPDLPVDEPTRKDPARRKTPVEEPPPDPVNQPDGVGQPDEPDEDDDDLDPVKAPAKEPIEDWRPNRPQEEQIAYYF